MNGVNNSYDCTGKPLLINVHTSVLISFDVFLFRALDFTNSQQATIYKMSQRVASEPWRIKMAYLRYPGSDQRYERSPYQMLRPVTGKSRRTAGYVLLAWTAVLAVCIIALYQGLQCFRTWRESLSQILLSEGEESAEASRLRMEEMLNTWSDHSINYDYFSIRQPNFVDTIDSNLFGLKSENTVVLSGPKPNELVGRIHIVRNGTVHRDYDCGWKMDVTVLTSTPKGRIRRRFKVMLPLLVPQSNSFQHFLDGVVPKLVQVAPLLDMPNITVVIYRPWDRVIETILAKFGITEDRVHYYDNGYYSADYLINTCITPPIHPQLWRNARTTLGAPTTLPVHPNEAKVILLTRAKSRNIGRKIKNIEFVSHFLKSRYGDKFHVFQGGYSLQDAVSLFGKARIVIGVHGGAFYNMFMCPSGTNIIEVIPTMENGTYVPDGMAFNIVWKMAYMLDQNYWRLSEKPVSRYGDVIVDTEKLAKALDQADKTHGM